MTEPDHTEDPQMSYTAPTPNPVVRLILWFWHSYLILIGLAVLFVFGLFVSEGALWAIPLFAFFAYVAYIQIKNRKRRYSEPGNV